MASLIASGKRNLLDHILRHKTVDHICEKNLIIDIMGRGYKKTALYHVDYIKRAALLIQESTL